MESYQFPSTYTAISGLLDDVDNSKQWNFELWHYCIKATICTNIKFLINCIYWYRFCNVPYLWHSFWHLFLVSDNSTMAPPAAKKSKKQMESINSRLGLVMKSGKCSLGYRVTLKTIRSGKAKLVIIASNTPALRLDWEVSQKWWYSSALQSFHEPAIQNTKGCSSIFCSFNSNDCNALVT